MKNKIEEDKTPNAEWANWALLDALEKPETREAAKELIATRFKETLGSGFNEVGLGPRSFIVMTDWGTWGTGTTLAEACGKAKKAGAPGTAKAIATLVLNDDKPGVTSDGCPVACSKAAMLYLGAIGTLASVMRANPAKKGGA